MDRRNRFPGFLVVLVLFDTFCQTRTLGTKKEKLVICNAEPKKCWKVFEGIEKTLVELVKTDDVDTNMAAIVFSVDAIAQDYRGKEELMSNKDRANLSAMLLIKELATIDENGKGQCKPSTATLLDNVDKALKGSIAKLDPDEVPETRLGKILKHYLEKYLDNCDYKRRLEDFDQGKLQDIKTVIGSIIGKCARIEDIFSFIGPKIPYEDYVKNEPFLASNFTKASLKTWVKGSRKIVRQFLHDRLKELPANLQEVANVRHGLVMHLVKPCKEFVQRLTSVFSNHWTLSQYLKRYMKGPIEEEAEMHRHLAYFHGCKNMITHQHPVSLAVASCERQKCFEQKKLFS